MAPRSGTPGGILALQEFVVGVDRLAAERESGHATTTPVLANLMIRFPDRHASGALPPGIRWKQKELSLGKQAALSAASESMPTADRSHRR